MFKKLLIVVIIFGGVYFYLTRSGSNEKGSYVKGNSYVNSELGFSFDIPDGWSVFKKNIKNGPQKVLISVTNPDKDEVFAILFLNANFPKSDKNPPYPLSELDSNMSTAIMALTGIKKKKMGNYELQDASITNFSGESCVVFTEYYRIPDGDIAGERNYAFLKDSRYKNLILSFQIKGKGPSKETVKNFESIEGTWTWDLSI